MRLRVKSRLIVPEASHSFLPETSIFAAFEGIHLNRVKLTAADIRLAVEQQAIGERRDQTRNGWIFQCALLGVAALFKLQ